MSRPEETLAELARLAREDEALGDELPPELRAPLSAEKTSAIAGAIHARLARTREPQRPEAEVTSLSARRRFFAAGGAALVAMAAGALLFVGNPAAPLPEYDAKVEGAERPERSSGPRSDDTLRLRPGSKLRFQLRPRTEYTDPVSARLTLSSPGTTSEPLELTEERSAEGALQVEARLPDGLPARGELVLRVEPAGTREGARQFRWPFERSP